MNKKAPKDGRGLVVRRGTCQGPKQPPKTTIESTGMNLTRRTRTEMVRIEMEATGD